MTNDEKRKWTNTCCTIVGSTNCAYPAKHSILCVTISVLVFLSPAGAQSVSNGSPPQQFPYRFSPSLAVIIVILIAALFFMGFFSIYIRRCSDGNPGGSVRRLGASVRRRPASRGLDTEVIETFPTVVYSMIKGLKIGKGALECAVCLNEFEDEDTLRLIPKCDHVFHPECIDAWLTSHVTCPVCRANLVPQPGETLHLQVPDLDLHLHPEFDDHHTAETQNQNLQPNDEVSIRVVEDPPQEDETPPSSRVVLEDRNKSVKNQNGPLKSRSLRARLFGKFPRSHSTGHSLIQPGENTERFTLRLPEDVKKQVMSRQPLNRTTSCLVMLPREGSSRRGYPYRMGFGEGSSGRRSGRSDRWVFSMAPPFFSRASSLRSPKVMTGDPAEGKGSTPRGTKLPVKLPSFKRSDSKGDKICLESADSAQPPV